MLAGEGEGVEEVFWARVVLLRAMRRGRARERERECMVGFGGCLGGWRLMGWVLGLRRLDGEVVGFGESGDGDGLVYVGDIGGTLWIFCYFEGLIGSL